MNILIAIFAVGSVALFESIQTFPPIWYDELTWTLLVVWLAGSMILAAAKKYDDNEESDSYLPRKRYIAIALVPWLISAGIYANAVFDRSSPVAYRTTVISRSKGRYGSDVRVSPFLQSHGARVIPVRFSCFDALMPGTEVYVQIKRGAIQVPWIAGVSSCM